MVSSEDQQQSTSRSGEYRDDIITFKDIVALMAVGNLLDSEIRVLSLLEIQTEINRIVNDTQHMIRRITPINSMGSVSVAIGRLITAKFVEVVDETDRQAKQYALRAEARQFMKELVRRYSKNFLRWPIEIPMDAEGNLEWGQAKFPDIA